MSDIPVRIMQFEFDAKELKDNIPNMHASLGLSMTLPYLEPYLIRTMREALKHTSDDAVATEVKQFIGQEAQHFRQHRILNDLLRNCHDGYADIQKIEDQMEADYQHFSKTKSLKFNLAYAEGFEAATCAIARNALANTDVDAPMSDLSGLFIWHLTEEIEHRTVTFNIYHHLYGDYLYRLCVGIYGQYHFFKYVIKFARFIKKHQPADISPAQDAMGPKRSFGAAASLLASLLSTYLPWYNPGKIKLPKNVAKMSARYSDLALETRVAG